MKEVINIPYIEYWITFIVLICILIIIKTYIICNLYKVERLLFFVRYSLSDFPIVIIFLLLTIINNHFLNWYNYVINTFLLISCVHFYIDLICISYFKCRAFLPEIFSFFSKKSFIQYYKKIIYLIFTFTLLLFVSRFISQKITIEKRFLIYLLIISSLAYIGSITYLKITKRKIEFLWNIYTLNNILRKSNWRYIWNYKKRHNKYEYIDYIKKEKGEWRNINIILVFAESLSAIDSKILWWYDNMPWFDKIQKEGIIFKNFISNWTNSLWWHVSLLEWVLPYKYNSYNWFKNLVPSLPKFLNKIWYNTIFISTCSLWFLWQRNRLKKIWFKHILGEENFIKEKKYCRNSAPDWILYLKVLNEIKKQKWKYFIWLQTISSHPDFRDYNSPYWRTKKDALKYSDDKLYEFYLSLKKINYFESWLLIIVWDHRKPTWMDNYEDKKLWKNWYTKAAATIVWKGITKWTINEKIIQHTDFFHSIKQLTWTNNVQLDKTYNNIFNKTVNRNRWITTNPSKYNWKDMFTISYSDKTFFTFNKITRKGIKDNNIYEYLTAHLKLQFEGENITWKIKESEINN